VVGFSEQYGNLATFYASGLARRTTVERVKRLLEDIYKDKILDVRFAVLYGSRKEFSDIDVFIVGKNPQEAHSNFLDVKMQSPRDLRKGIKNFDVRTLIPLMNGEFICGDKDYFEKLREQVLFQPISEESIKHNLKWSSRMQRLRDENFEDDFLRSKFEGYSQTYLSNALALMQGKRLFTKEDLISYSKRASVEGDKPPQ
jgi:predicted nucleotidyltransferase